MTEEEWRPVVGYEGLYEVSNLGRVRSVFWKTPRIRKQAVLKAGGYLGVSLSCRPERLHPVMRTVHSLVMQAFVGPLPEGMVVRHLDGNAQNANLRNLSYSTQSENQLDKRGHGTDPMVNKTHCPKGHAYSEANIYSPPSRPNARYCRACSIGRKRG